MTPAPSGPANWRQAFAVYIQPRVLIVLFLGFSSGLPLALSGSTLLIWMRQAGVDLGTIGLFALVGTPYTIKFLWAPLVDALALPVLTKALGRRRGWLVFAQGLLVLAIICLAMTNPQNAPGLVALFALLVAAASATQDIVVDAFRVETLRPEEQAAGMAAYVAAYRIGMLISTAGALFLVTGFEHIQLLATNAWMWGYLAMALLVLLGTAAALMATEPDAPLSSTTPPLAAQESSARRIFNAARLAFTEFLTQPNAFAILAFVILYKLCDAYAGTMTAPFVIDLGFSRDDYAAIVKGVGLIATLIGGFAGGLIARRLSLVVVLWIGGILQALSNLAFAGLALVGKDYWALSGAIIVENFTGAIGTVIFVAYLSALCKNPLHTATQYALLTALAAIGRTYLASSAGFIAAQAGWASFFALSLATALPAFALMIFLQMRGHFMSLVHAPERSE